MLMPVERLIVALDVDNAKEVANVCDSIGENAVFYKVGLQLYIAGGKHIVDYLKARNLKVFLDLKLHDIPNQVAGACREIVRMGVDMMTIHTSGGADMMKAAAKSVSEAADEFGVRSPVLLGVTVLTSLNQLRAGEIGFNRSIPEQVVALAELAKSCGLDGVVASPQEVGAIRSAVGDDFVVVTPGIRSAEDAVQDQQRIMSAGDAIKAGASYLVVGRPILKADDPSGAAARIVAQIDEAAG